MHNNEKKPKKPTYHYYVIQKLFWIFNQTDTFSNQDTYFPAQWTGLRVKEMGGGIIWWSPGSHLKKNWLKSVNPTISTEKKKVLIHQ